MIIEFVQSIIKVKVYEMISTSLVNEIWPHYGGAQWLFFIFI